LGARVFGRIRALEPDDIFRHFLHNLPLSGLFSEENYPPIVNNSL
jgi:hypothetical protein